MDVEYIIDNKRACWVKGENVPRNELWDSKWNNLCNTLMFLSKAASACLTGQYLFVEVVQYSCGWQIKTSLPEKPHWQTVVNRFKLCWFGYAYNRVGCKKYDFLFGGWINWVKMLYACKLICFSTHILISKDCSSFENLISAHLSFRENAQLICRIPLLVNPDLLMHVSLSLRCQMTTAKVFPWLQMYRCMELLAWD